MKRRSEGNTRKPFIGRDVKVVDSSTPSYIGIEGGVVDETKMSLVVDTVDGRKRILKRGTSFEFGDGVIHGDMIRKRPEQRIKSRGK